MKKRVIFFLGSVICFSVIIGMIGFVKNKSSIGNGQVTTEEVSSSVAAETATDMAASASDKDEEQQFFEQAVENKEKVEHASAESGQSHFSAFCGYTALSFWSAYKPPLSIYLQNVHFIPDNRILAERAFYCCFFCSTVCLAISASTISSPV